MMKGLEEHFLLFIVGIFVILIVMTTVFGKGIAYSYLGFISTIEPMNLQENIRNILTVASFSTGDFEAKIPINVKHSITITDNPKTILVEAEPANQLSQPQPQPFLSDCEIPKRCTKVCKLIGERCSEHEDCCGLLSCNSGYCQASIGMCGNHILDDGEECEPEDLDATPSFSGIDTDCPGQCQDDCSCSIDFEEGDICTSSSQCYRLMECVTFVRLYDVGESMIIRKYVEAGQCKITIEGSK